MCVLAVPGAGKTYSLVKRLEYLIKSGIKPTEILFVTFTRKGSVYFGDINKVDAVTWCFSSSRICKKDLRSSQ